MGSQIVDTHLKLDAWLGRIILICLFCLTLILSRNNCGLFIQTVDSMLTVWMYGKYLLWVSIKRWLLAKSLCHLTESLLVSSWTPLLLIVYFYQLSWNRQTRRKMTCLVLLNIYRSYEPTSVKIIIVTWNLSHFINCLCQCVTLLPLLYYYHCKCDIIQLYETSRELQMYCALFLLLNTTEILEWIILLKFLQTNCLLQRPLKV